MPARALSLAETAAEIGRSADWLRDNWRRLSGEARFPQPIHECGGLVWSAAQLYAWLDRKLPREQRVAAAAFRAALDAATAADPIGDGEVDAWRRHLNARFAGTETP